jgi:hypothetical protein
MCGQHSQIVFPRWLSPPDFIFATCLQKAAAAADPIVEGCRAVLYADFLRPGGPEAARYEEVTDTSKLLQAVEEALGEYNAQVWRERPLTAGRVRSTQYSSCTTAVTLACAASCMIKAAVLVKGRFC